MMANINMSPTSPSIPVAAKTGHEKTAIERQIDAIDHQIDNLVYELYGLTEEEISLIESTR